MTLAMKQIPVITTSVTLRRRASRSSSVSVLTRSKQFHRSGKKTLLIVRVSAVGGPRMTEVATYLDVLTSARFSPTLVRFVISASGTNTIRPIGNAF
jgi:hypothetical protein